MMPQLPSDSLYGTPANTRETQLRYTPLAAHHDHIWAQLMSALRQPTHTHIQRETRRAKVWARGGLLLLILGIALDIELLRLAAISLLGFLACLWLWDAVSLVGLRYARRFSSAVGPAAALDQPRAFTGESLELTLELKNSKPVPLAAVVVEDILPAAVALDGIELRLSRATGRQEFRLFWMPGALQTLTRTYQMRCIKRGYHTLGPAKLTTGDGGGFFSRTVMLANPQQLIVYPRLYTAAELGLPVENPFGQARAQQRLVEDPLRTAGVREWQPGDGLSRVHWKATAMHRRLLSRLYEPSAETQLVIFLNVATLERYWEGRIVELEERAISVAGSVAALGLESRMPVGLLINAYWPGSDQVMRLLPGRSPQQLMRILEMLAAVDLPNRAIETQLLKEAPRLPWGATLLVVSATVYPALLEAMDRLARAGRSLVLLTLSEDLPTVPNPHIGVYRVPAPQPDLMQPLKVLPC